MITPGRPWRTDEVLRIAVSKVIPRSHLCSLSLVRAITIRLGLLCSNTTILGLDHQGKLGTGAFTSGRIATSTTGPRHLPADGDGVCRPLPEMALLGPRQMSDLSPQNALKRTSIRSLSQIAIL